MASVVEDRRSYGTAAPPSAGERLMALAVGGPALLLVAAAVATAVLAANGRIAFARDQHLTMAEAAALEDSGEIVRLRRRGVDVHQPSRVRAGIIRDVDMTMTPLEAAIIQDHPDVVDLLVREGAPIDRRNFAALWCLAQSHDDAVVLRFLEARAPVPLPRDCSDVRTVLDEPQN